MMMMKFQKPVRIVIFQIMAVDLHIFLIVRLSAFDNFQVFFNDIFTDDTKILLDFQFVGKHRWDQILSVC